MTALRFLLPDARWALERVKRTVEKHILLPRASIETQTPDLFDEVRVDRNVAIPMRDGTRLYADLYQPKTVGSRPAILTRLPYGKDESYCSLPAAGRFWARKGYSYVAQDVRGKWRSEGAWDPFIHEASDGYDTLDWIAAQPWCDGKIGMLGESYYGYTCWAAATTGHPNLKCVSPSTTAMDIYGSWIYVNGAFCLGTMGTWAIKMNARQYRNPFRLDTQHLPLAAIDSDARLPCNYYQDWLAHPTRDAYWDAINLHHKYTRIRVPALHFGGWYDMFLKATLDDWRGVRQHSEDATARDNQWLVIGPWDHDYTPDESGRIGQLDIGAAGATAYWDLCQAFFDYWLRGQANGFDQMPRVRFFTTGENAWRTGDHWPPSGITYSDYYLHSQGNAQLKEGDGQLDEKPPAPDELEDQYLYDPNDPVALTAGVDLWSRARCLQDRGHLPARPDVLIYDSAPLQEDLEITGPVSVTLYAASTALDTDFAAVLVDLFPDGYAHLVQESITRASYRESDRSPSPIEPGRVYEYMIDLWATSHVIKAGHRIRLEIASSNFDRFDRNPNTGETGGTATTPITAHQRVFHTARYPSRLTLPVPRRGHWEAPDGASPRKALTSEPQPESAGTVPR